MIAAALSLLALSTPALTGGLEEAASQAERSLTQVAGSAEPAPPVGPARELPPGLSYIILQVRS